MKEDSAKIAVPIVIVLVVLGLGYFLVRSNPSTTSNEQLSNAQTPEVTKTAEPIVQDQPIKVDKDSDFSDKPVKVPPQPGEEIAPHYKVYSADALKAELEAQKNVLLFFHADWCPTCRAAERDILSNNHQLPENLSILKVDFDTQKDLKAQHNIVSQHTFVLLDANGDEVTKWGGGGVETILENIANPL